MKATPRIKTQINLLAPILLSVFLIACGGGDRSDPPSTDSTQNRSVLNEPAVSVAQFASDDELLNFVRESRSLSFDTPGLINGGSRAGELAGPPTQSPDTGATPADGVAAPAPASGNTHSDTNLQEAGVDEPDIIKTNGDYLYVATDHAVNIVSAAVAPAMALSASIAVAGEVIGMILTPDEKLAIFYAPSVPLPLPLQSQSSPIFFGPDAQPKTGILIADVSDPTQPKTLRDSAFDGYYGGARRIDSTLYVYFNTWIDTPQPPGPNTETDTNDVVVRLPSSYTRNADGTYTDEGPAITATQIYRPDTPRGLSMTLIVGIDLASPDDAFTSTAYVGNAALAYSSSQALYLIDVQWIGSIGFAEPPVQISGPAQSRGDTASAPPPAMNTPSSVRTTQARAVTDGPHSVIHKFTFDATGVSLAASGHVPGSVLDQYAVSEHEGFLRIASSVSWESGQGADVFVLEQQAAELNVVGSVTGIGAGEQLYAARFVGERGYVVTFLQTDPLFSIDLSDPRNPQQVGELVIPGFSNYLHVADSDHLLGIGHNASDTGQRLGLQLSVFDVSLIDQPARVAKADIGSPFASSEATWNPKAFTYWENERLIAFPVQYYADSAAPFAAPNLYEGIFIFKLQPDFSLTFTGSMDDYSTFNTPWNRVVFIEDRVYAINRNKIRVALLADVTTPISVLEMAAAKPVPPPVILN